MEHRQEESIAFRINTGNIQGLIAQIERKWKTMASGLNHD